MRVFVRLARWLAVLAVAAAIGAAVYAWRALPRTDGELRLAGPRAEIRIERDAQGIPTIRAGSLADAAFALGFVHAQDRLWQLEVHRRTGAGRLAEAFGESALPTDRFLRALGVRRTAAAQWARLTGEPRDLLLAYAQGINAVLRDELRARPPEHLILGLQPEPWEPVDSLAWSVMMAWDLGGNWNLELLRLRLALRMPVERVNQILPPYPGDAPVASADYAALYRGLGLGSGKALVSLEMLPDIAPESGVEGVGSNNWVVAPSHSSTGAPLLANDPHLGLSAPALWYFVRIEVPGLRVAGATLPGLPSVVLGQNEHIAWGFTNTGPDVQDLYVEQLDPADAGRYRTPDGWARFETADEVIRVKGRPDVPVRVRWSRHGPVISDAGSADDVVAGTPQPATHALALRWTALDADADSLRASVRMFQADSVANFVAATREWVAPMQNMVVADRAGHIGFVAAGRVPLRRPDNDLHGLAPAPGWDARYDWAGWLAPDETPRELDPARGWIATANQRIHGPGYPHHLTHDWTAPFRQQRIEELLRTRPRHTLEDLARMQADARSLAAPQLIAWLRKARSTHALAAAASRQLEGFDGLMAPDRAAPLIYWAWVRQLGQAVFADEVGADLWERSMANRTLHDALVGVLERDDAHWCDDRSTPVIETCQAMVDRALTRALDELQERFGSDVTAWAWGRAHLMRADHRPFSRVAVLARWFELRVPTAGDTYTINATRVTLKPHATTGELYLNEHGPSLRAVYDVAEPGRSRFVHSTGQSGIPWSPLYRSLVQPWADVRYVPLWSEGGPADVLILKPG